MRHLYYLVAAVPALLLGSAQAHPATPSGAAVQPVAWSAVNTVDLKAFNKGLERDKPTIDVAIYVPSNFDATFDRVTLPRMLEGLRAAKEI